jgi:hypothetical protein
VGKEVRDVDVVIFEKFCEPGDVGVVDLRKKE